MQENLQNTIRRIIEGDQEAFRKLVEAYQHQAFVLAFRILRDEEEAKDAVQEGFVKIWRNIKNYNTANKFSAWMYRIMANCSIDRIRKIHRRNEVTLEEDREDITGIRKTEPDMIMDNKEIARTIRILAGKLPEKQQAVFILRDIQGMESAEVQTILGISESQVKSNLHHARRSIRSKLEMIFYK